MIFLYFSNLFGPHKYNIYTNSFTNRKNNVLIIRIYRNITAEVWQHRIHVEIASENPHSICQLYQHLYTTLKLIYLFFIKLTRWQPAQVLLKSLFIILLGVYSCVYTYVVYKAYNSFIPRGRSLCIFGGYRLHKANVRL